MNFVNIENKNDHFPEEIYAGIKTPDHECPEKYFKIEQLLSELETLEQKQQAQKNLGITRIVQSLNETDQQLVEDLNKEIQRASQAEQQLRTQINNSFREHSTIYENIIKVIRGISNNTDSSQDPFKQLGNFTTYDSLKSKLDTLIYDNLVIGANCGFFRAKLNLREVEIKNIPLHTNNLMQVISGMFAVKNGNLITSDQSYTIAFRCHNGTSWSEWTDITNSEHLISLSNIVEEEKQRTRQAENQLFEKIQTEELRAQQEEKSIKDSVETYNSEILELLNTHNQESIQQISEINQNITNLQNKDSQLETIITTDISNRLAEAEQSIINESNRAQQVEQELHDKKANTIGYYPNLTSGFSVNLTGRGEATNEQISYRPTANSKSIENGVAKITNIKGKSLVWNQFASQDYINDYAIYGTYEIENGILKIDPTNADSYSVFWSQKKAHLFNNHKWLCKAVVKSEGSIIIKGMATHNYVFNQFCTIWTIFDSTNNINSIWNWGLTTQDKSKPVYISEYKVYDLTLMFGDGNEPESLEEFNSYFTDFGQDYNEGELISFKPKSLKTVGFNQFNKETVQVGVIGNFGEIIADNWGSTYRYSDYIKVIPNQTYYLQNISNVYHTRGLLCYDNNKQLLRGVCNIAQDNSGVYVINHVQKIPSCVKYIRIVTPKDYVDSCCVNLVHSGYRNGEYENYKESNLSFNSIYNIKDSEGNILFPDGLRSAGSVYDEITETQAIKRIGVVDLGDLLWVGSTQQNYANSFMATIANKAVGKNLLCVPYPLHKGQGWINESYDKLISGYNESLYRTMVWIRDSNYSDAESFKKGVAGTKLYYELAEPIVINLSNNFNYETWDFGTEQIISDGFSTSMNADIIYDFNAVDTIRGNNIDIADIKTTLPVMSEKIDNEITRSQDFDNRITDDVFGAINVEDGSYNDTTGLKFDIVNRCRSSISIPIRQLQGVKITKNPEGCYTSLQLLDKDKNLLRNISNLWGSSPADVNNITPVDFRNLNQPDTCFVNFIFKTHYQTSIYASGEGPFSDEQKTICRDWLIDLLHQNKNIDTAIDNKIKEHSTVRFDRIEEDEVTINTGEVDTLSAIVYYKPANKFVATDNAGAYWDTWLGMEAYMIDGTIRKDKVYLCGDKVYIMQNVSNPYTTAVYKLREIGFVDDSKAIARHFNYIGNYPFSQKAIDAGVDKMIIAGYLDIEYEEGKAYCFCVAIKNSSRNRLTLYKKDKDLPNTEANVTNILSFDLIKIDNSPYYQAKCKQSPKSWFIIDWDNVKSYDSLYDYDGIALSPSLFKGCGLSSRIEQIYSESIQGARILNNSIDAVKLRNQIFITENKYSSSIAELYILPKYQVDGVFRYKVYNEQAYLRSYSGSTIIYNTRVKLPDESYNEEVLPLVVYQSNDANIAVNDIAGYIVFRKGYIEDDNNSMQGEELNMGYITVEGYAPRISQYIKDNVPTTEEDVDYSYLISIPATFDVVAGDTLQIFKRAVVKKFNPYTNDVLMTCKKGKDYPRYYSFATTASDANKTYTLKVQIKDDKGEVINEKSTTINVVPPTTATDKNILLVGASSLASGYISTELKRRLTETSGDGTPANPTGLGLNLNFVGRKSSQGVNQEATGGWRLASYAGTGVPACRFFVSGVTQLNMGDIYKIDGYEYTITEINVTDGAGNIRAEGQTKVALSTSGTLTRSRGDGDESITYSRYEAESYNPFYNNTTGKLDFISYANSWCNGRIDCLVFHCGVNDLFTNDPIDNVMGYARTLASLFHEQFPSGKVVFSTLPLPDCTGGMAANYGTSHDYYGKALKFWAFAEAIELLAKETELKDYVSVSRVLPTFDCEYGYPKTATPVNNRVATTEQLGTNGVHPTADGSKMVADAIYATLNKVL